MSDGIQFTKIMDFKTKEMFEIADYFCVTVNVRLGVASRLDGDFMLHCCRDLLQRLNPPEFRTVLFCVPRSTLRNQRMTISLGKVTKC